MSVSLTVRIVRVALVLCAAIVAALLFFHFLAFDSLYRSGMLNRYQNELWQAVTQFGGADRTGDKPLADYTAVTGAPVMVCTSLLDFADRDFFHLLPTITVAPGDGEEITLVTALLDTGGTPLALVPGDIIEFSALRLGSSQCYDSLSLTRESAAYSAGLAAEWPEGETLSSRGRVVSVGQPPQGQAATLARELYLAFRESLVSGDLSPEALETVLAAPIKTDRGTTLHFFYEHREVGDVSYHFISLRPVNLTGQERFFAGSALTGMLAVIVTLVMLCALYLAWQLRRPLGRLVSHTDKLTNLDFSGSPPAGGPGEIGQLAANIGAMSKSLESALEALQAASETSAKNEERLKLLLSDLAHEFKTPLGIISSHFEVLEKGYHEGNVEEYFEVLDDEIDRLSEMVNEVIELSKLQTGNWRIDIGVWDLPEMIQTVMLKFSKQFDAQGFTVDWTAPDVSVRVDARRIEQVFSNLLSNALKYSDDHRRITITAQVDAEDHVSVFVRNSGHLSESERDRIWDRYYSTGLFTKARLPSEGIGLDIVKTILVSHKSRFGVTQEEGMTSFYFSLPVDGSPLPETEN